jgi:hypothetical protein
MDQLLQLKIKEHAETASHLRPLQPPRVSLSTTEDSQILPSIYQSSIFSPAPNPTIAQEAL